jgi:hypothetical protein
MAVPAGTMALSVGPISLWEYPRRRQPSLQPMPQHHAGADGGPCPGDPPPPSHLRVMPGIAKPELQQWALSLVYDPATKFGQMAERVFEGRPVAARIEHHTWTTHGADVLPGCFKGVTLYEHKGDAAVAGGPYKEKQMRYSLGLDRNSFEPDHLPVGSGAGYSCGALMDPPGGRQAIAVLLHVSPDSDNLDMSRPESLEQKRQRLLWHGAQTAPIKKAVVDALLAMPEVLVVDVQSMPLLIVQASPEVVAAITSPNGPLAQFGEMVEVSPDVRFASGHYSSGAIAQGTGFWRRFGDIVAILLAFDPMAWPMVYLYNYVAPERARIPTPPEVFLSVIPRQLGAATPLAPLPPQPTPAPTETYVAGWASGGSSSPLPMRFYGALDPRGIGLPRLGSAYPESPNFDPLGPPEVPLVTREEAFAAAQQLQSMFSDVRSVVAQAPDGFYVRVITSLGGGGGRFGQGLGQPLFGPKGLRAPSDREVWRAIDRLPPQIGRVRVVMDRFVSPDFAVAGEFAVGGAVDIPIDEARAAQEKLRYDLIERCKCVLNWMRGVGLNCIQSMCGPDSTTECRVTLLVDGNKMSDEAREMVPATVGRVPVEIQDIGDGPVPRGMEIVAP